MWCILNRLRKVNESQGQAIILNRSNRRVPVRLSYLFMDFSKYLLEGTLSCKIEKTWAMSCKKTQRTSTKSYLCCSFISARQEAFRGRIKGQINASLYAQLQTRDRTQTRHFQRWSTNRSSANKGEWLLQVTNELIEGSYRENRNHVSLIKSCWI